VEAFVGKNKYKRTNYLIDKPFQLGFIFKYLLVIICTVAVCFLLAVGWFYYRSLYGENILNEIVVIQMRSNKTKDGYYKYLYDKEKIIVYKVNEKGNVKYYVYDNKGNENYHKNQIVAIDDENALHSYASGEEIRTNVFSVVIPPLLVLCVAIMLIIAVYSLFFSHKMAGPIYRIRVSLDRMNSGDLDFKIRARQGDFFLNIVEKLEHFRIKVKNNDFGADFPHEKVSELKGLVKDGADKEDVLKKINEIFG
jgi:methyl-accepting chemotaxis protein